MLYLVSVNDDASTEEVEMPITKFTTQLKCCVNVILSEDKRGKVKISINSNDRAMVIAEQISELFGETKYSISFFMTAVKIDLNTKIADLGIGFYKDGGQESNEILCMKGGVDAPKIFNRFKHVDSPER